MLPAQSIHLPRRLAVLCLLFPLAAPVMGQETKDGRIQPAPSLLEIKLRSRDETAEGSGKFVAATEAVHWDPHKTAVVICDMWDNHWCRAAAQRVAEMAPRMNQVVARLRERGVLIIHCPGETMRYYSDHPARKAVLAARPADLPKRRTAAIPAGRFPIDDSDGGCPDEPRCPMGQVWQREIAALEIKPGDGISDHGDEVYNFLRQKGVENVIVMGVHTNMCVLNRPYGIKALLAKGLRVALVRDLTDTMYNPRMPPHVDHFTGTDLVIEYIEKYWCPSFTSDQILGGTPFRFAADHREDTARPMGNRGLVIVVPRRLEALLKPFVEYRRRSLPVEVAVLESVLEKYSGVDDPEKLKRFLYSAWKSRKAHYVLLVGDATMVPVRYMVLDRVTPAAFDTAFYPSDLYYADIAHKDGSFEDWNGRKDGYHAQYFGEVHGEKNKQDPINFDRIGYVPSLAVGRWPVNSADEVTTLVKKTIAYEERVSADRAGRPRMGLVNHEGFVDARDRMDRMAAWMPRYWAIERCFYSDANRKSPRQPTEMEVVDLLSSGVDVVVHVGHGSDNSWQGCLSTHDLAKIKNAAHLPVMISAGCSTARFATLPPYEPYVDARGAWHKGTDAGEVFHGPPPAPAPYQTGRANSIGLGRQFVCAGPNGAIAYYGCNTGGQGCGITLLEGFVKAWSQSPEPRLGDCWIGAVTYYYEKEKLATIKPNADWYPPSIFFQGMKYMLFGDPTLQLPR
jgi:nicotinamidase-related amidase